jgi:hypothetical protein
MGYQVLPFLRRVAKSDYYLLHACPSVCLSVHMKQLGSHWTEFHEIWYLIIFQTPVEKMNLIKIWHDRRLLYMKTYISISIHIWRYVAELFLLWAIFQKRLVERIKIQMLCSITVYENGVLYKIVWKNMVEADRPQITCFACWRTKTS